MRIGDYMTRSLETIESSEPLQAAALRMSTCGIGALPVTEQGQLVGMLTDRDITVRATALGKDPLTTPVREVMTARLVTCSEDAPLAEAERLMEERAVRRLVVLDARSQPVGLISLDDLATAPGEAPRAGEVLERLNLK